VLVCSIGSLQVYSGFYSQLQPTGIYSCCNSSLSTEAVILS